MAAKVYQFTCKKCGKRARRGLVSRGRKPTICETCRLENEREYQRHYMRRRAAEKRAT